MIESASTSSPSLLALLRQHPRVRFADESHEDHLTFVQDGWARRVFVGRPELEVSGLPEIMDNNPMVCADEISVPDPASTLALIGLAPLVRAGLLLEQPAMMTNVQADADLTERFLLREGWVGGIAIDVDPKPLGGAAAATIIACVMSTSNSDLESLYDERFEQSFFVRRAQEESWDIAAVVGTRTAVYRVQRAIDDSGLITVQVMADLGGKCGAGQIVHAMNIMAGYEESLP